MNNKDKAIKFAREIVENNVWSDRGLDYCIHCEEWIYQFKDHDSDCIVLEAQNYLKEVEDEQN